MTDNRNYTIARFIRIAKAPEDMSTGELITTIEELAEYASHRVTECHSLRNILNNAITKGN